jgi:hypothetical protein
MTTLTELWTAMAAGNASVLESATLHRVMRERGASLIKGRDDVVADCIAVLARGGSFSVIADLGDMAVIQAGDRHIHHWVRREDDRIAFDMVIEASGAAVDMPGAVIERRIVAADQTAQLFHLFEEGDAGRLMRRIGSQILGTDMIAIGLPIAND